MNCLDYTYIFSPITNTLARICFIDYHKDEQHFLQVSVNDKQLLRKSLRQIPTEVADFVDIAVAVYVADRLSIQKADMPRSIGIVMPVRNPEILSNPQIIEHLQDVLNWYTDDHWSFEFTPHTAYDHPAQTCMSFESDGKKPVEVALWSGGLDSLAGLYNRLLIEPLTHYTLFGTGANTFIHSTQLQLARAIRKEFSDRIAFVQFPIQLNGTKGLRKSSSQRTRGFVFMLLGAVCAYMEGQNSLYIYENGVGAINLPFRESEVGLDHSRSVHPLSLLHMSNLVSQLLSKSFTFRNPFWLWTKAQMCERLAHTAATDLIFLTITCDRLHREQPMQCGRCSSCWLRRQALAVQEIEDRTAYLATVVSPYDSSHRPSDADHLRAMRYQVDTLRSLLNENDPWRSIIKQYSNSRLSDIVDRKAKQEGIAPAKLKEQLLQLYKRYVREWDSVQHIIGQRLLEDEEIKATG